MRRPSLFVLAAAMLALSSSVGFVWVLLSESVNGTTDTAVRLGTSGGLAVSIGWAAFAPSYRQAALRTVVAVAFSAFVAALLIWAYFWVLPTVQEWFADDGSGSLELYVVAVDDDSPPVPVLVALVLAGGLLGMAARFAAKTDRSVHGRVVGALLVGLVIGDGAVWLSWGAQVAFALSFISAAWLVWALRGASAAHASRLQTG